MLHKAYSLLSIKSIDDEQRIIHGIASTPTPDRGGDVVEPFGVKFRNPLPFVLHHDKKSPVGDVSFGVPTKHGIPFEARIPKVTEPGIVQDRTDEAWHSAKYGLLKGVSVGYLPIKATPRSGGGMHLKEIEVLELSMVAVPMNAETTILAIKSLDESYLAASGTQVDVLVQHAGVSAPVVRVAQKGARAMNVQKKTPSELITDYRGMLLQKSSRMDEMVDKSAEDGSTFDAAQTEEYDTLDGEVKSIEAHLKRMEEREAREVKMATRVVATTPQKAAEVRSSNVVILKPELPKGTLFTRYAMAVAAGKGSISDTLAFAKRWDGQTPEVTAYIKAVEGTTIAGSPAWGSELVYAQNLVSEFVDLLRAATLIDRIAGIRRVPPNVRIPVQTGGSTVNWVGEAAPKPVTELAFDAITLGYDKIAGIVVLTDELVRLSSPSAEEAVRRDLVEQITRFMDAQFVTPSVTATASRPASITNGVSAITGSGSTADDLYADLNAALATFDDSEMGENSIHILMPPALARGVSALRNALGQFEFRDVSRNGGTLMGFPVLVSSTVPAGTIVVVKADEILMADDGRVTLDASNQATLDMAGGSSPDFNLWQKNCTAIRAERWITWRKRRADAVALIQTATYGPPVGS